jgi:hypothetical protein
VGELGGDFAFVVGGNTYIVFLFVVKVGVLVTYWVVSEMSDKCHFLKSHLF